jgi:putative ABC transport system substrate-binding protein
LNSANLQAFREHRSALSSADAELVRLPVDLIVTRGTPAALAAKKATIPIVIAASGDPVRTGLVQGLAHTGGNVTGPTSLTREMAGKRLKARL